MLRSRSVRQADWMAFCTGSGLGDSRRLLRRHLEAWGLDDQVFEAQLLLSELLSNVDAHARQRTATVKVTVDGAVLRVEVRDALRDKVPCLVPAHPSRIGGMGMRLVAITAPRWGTTVDEQGKDVWFELTTSPPPE